MMDHSANTGLRAHLRQHLKCGASALPRSGMTMVELMISMVILTMCCGMLTSTLSATGTHRRTSLERAVAVEAARSVLEDMHNWNFGAVFTTYNSDPEDDPDGPGTAPGKYFSVEGLSPAADDLDGFVGEIFFPADRSPLLETVEDADLGMPRDLNGDLKIDEADHTEDHLVLPVRLVVRWQGRGGIRSFEISTILADLELLK